ncbi:penicillin-insensitive murein endopeptidase [Roseicyclus sp. F158]|uniref:Penicillin-insensitive murein endopeptidase n=1 Tax=Tropicimonas omnivorans TaxID=3075590 RepID=A0ABU3DC16_9RHOB|nr:penicillin-insensitive murein endopeptidase [Roseicyclus sp. F158]MDT0681210.1 penicillin-insensitive murein endopeptidase [Roseicyclus sp. F158]
MGAIRTFFTTFALTFALAIPAAAQTKANQLFGAKGSPSRQAPAAYGEYSKGCLAGGVQMPETGRTWQAMRLSRNRNWGHPEMIDFLGDLSHRVQRIGWPGLYIGDISQARGGPMLSGHASHQMGLDADVWMRKPQSLTLSRAERERIGSTNMRSANQRTVSANYSPDVGQVIQIAALDPRVDRIFVTPPVKIELCKRANRKDRKWLQKVRPLSGHNTHFHVRLKCPRGDRACETQRPTVDDLSNGGSGCDETLMWWVTDYLDPPKRTAPAKPSKPAPRKRGARDYTMADLPRQCAQVLSAP